MAKQEGWNYRQIHPAPDDIPIFVRGEERAEREYADEQKYFKRAQSLITVPQARVRDESGLVFLPNGDVCFECNWWLPAMKKLPGYSTPYRKKRTLQGDVFSLLGLWSSAYYHWFHDVLPRLWNSLPHLPESLRFLIHENYTSFQLESLKALGIGEDRLIVQPTSGDSVVERLWFATPLGTATFGGGGPIRNVGRVISQKIGKPKHQNLRIYISRSCARYRRILNENNLIPILEKFGFTILNMENLSFQDQVKVSSRASHMVGMHGAGLVNCIFSKSKMTLGEISIPSPVPCYSVLARQLGYTFQRFSVGSSLDESADLFVNPDDFEDWLRNFIAE